MAIVCALPCEARPLVQALELRPDGSAGLRRNRSVALQVGGVGAERAAEAVDGLAGHADACTCWLNVGCAGGRGTIGELVAAHKVSRAEGEVWYPQFPFPVEEPTAEVRTVPRPETSYPEPVLYEMEAAGFYAAAIKRASLERVQVLKVRVDSPEHPVDRLTTAGISDHVRGHSDAITAWIERLAAVARSVRARRPAHELTDAYLDRWHFTASQRVLLDRSLERLYALSVVPPPAIDLAAKDAREAIAALDELASRWPEEPRVVEK